MSWFASPPPPPPPLELPYEIVGAVLILIITFTIISKITAPRPLPAGKITGVVVYPLKSARGVNVRRASLGYALERAAVLGMRPPLVRLLGRMPDSDDGDARARRDPWGEQHGSMDLAQR